LKFKADFHSKMTICRHELRGVELPTPLAIPTLGRGRGRGRGRKFWSRGHVGGFEDFTSLHFNSILEIIDINASKGETGGGNYR